MSWKIWLRPCLKEIKEVVLEKSESEYHQKSRTISLLTFPARERSNAAIGKVCRWKVLNKLAFQDSGVVRRSLSSLFANFEPKESERCLKMALSESFGLSANRFAGRNSDFFIGRSFPPMKFSIQDSIDKIWLVQLVRPEFEHGEKLKLKVYFHFFCELKIRCIDCYQIIFKTELAVWNFSASWYLSNKPFLKIIKLVATDKSTFEYWCWWQMLASIVRIWLQWHKTQVFAFSVKNLCTHGKFPIRALQDVLKPIIWRDVTPNFEKLLGFILQFRFLEFPTRKLSSRFRCWKLSRKCKIVD